MAIKVLRIEADSDVDMPDDGYDGWKLVSFSKKHINNEDPYKYLLPNARREVTPATIGLRRKLDVGLAFWLSYYEHSSCVWSLKGEGPQCQWDGTQLAGILLWTGKPGDIGAKTYDDRMNDARNFLKEYTQWANGECYWFSVEDIHGNDIDSCGGFIGSDALVEAIAEHLDDGDLVIPKGMAADWLNYHHTGKQIEVIDEDDERLEMEMAIPEEKGLRSVDDPWQV